MSLQNALLQLDFNEKESTVYLALLEFGMQPASVIAKKTGYPKATVLFLFERLVTQGYLRKSQRGRVHYFFADPLDLQKAKTKKINTTQKTLDRVIPLLQEFKNPFTIQPKVTFFEGVEGCKKAYSLLLESTTEILEFATHRDLVEKFGADFMRDFMRMRSKKNIFLKAICKKDPAHAALVKKNRVQKRLIHFHPASYGTIYSSIAIFDNKVLLLNLYQDAFAILIENTQVAETLKTIHRIAWRAPTK